MRKFLTAMFLACISLFVLAACGGNDTPDEEASDTETEVEENTADADEKLEIVASFTIISDVVREVGGDKVEVYNLVPTGTDPHEYEPLPEDSVKASDADIVFYNGFNLEDEWFDKLMDSVGQDESRIFSVTDKVEPAYLEDEATQEEEVNPHTFIDPVAGIYMAEDVRDALIEIDPDNKEYYEERAGDYLDRLHELEKEYETRLGEIPEENRVLVTSECAYQYLLERYGFDEACIYKVDTEEDGSPEQITALVEYIEERNVPILFVESNVDPRPMETVSKESGVDIFETPIYSDEIGQPGDEVDTYVKYLEYNLDVITAGLGQ